MTRLILFPKKSTGTMGVNTVLRFLATITRARMVVGWIVDTYACNQTVLRGRRVCTMVLGFGPYNHRISASL